MADEILDGGDLMASFRDRHEGTLLGGLRYWWMGGLELGFDKDTAWLNFFTNLLNAHDDSRLLQLL